tara:strand:- start:544 stop:654 length:111 start_codon:yes stop_codon:yes gene_type:complete
MTTYSCPPFIEVYAQQASFRSDADFFDAFIWMFGVV